MCPAVDDSVAGVVGLPLAEDIRRAIGKLVSLHDGDLGVVETVVCGKRAIPALRQVLFAREPSGLYEPRRRAVEALAWLHADDVLIDFLGLPRDITDPVEQTGEDAVTNAAARALADSSDARVLPLLLAYAQRRPLAGVVEALGKRRCIPALPYFLKALTEDFTRPAAEVAIRGLGPQVRVALLETATRSAPEDIPETVSSRRQRRSALSLFAVFGPPAKEEFSRLYDLMRDRDPEIAALACEICLASAAEPAKVSAVVRLIDLLSSADWLLTEKIEDCLVRHFNTAEKIVESELRRGDAGTDLCSPRPRTMDALHRIAARAASMACHAGR